MELDEDELRNLIHNRLLVDELLNQRVNNFIFVLPKEVDAYYQEHPSDFGDQPVTEVESEIQAILIQEKTKSKRKGYIERLRSRATIRFN